jgi:hypothetical protein
VSFKKGDSISLKVRVFSFKAADISSFLAKFHQIRKDVTGQTKPHDQVPFSTMFSLLSEKIDNTRWYNEPNKFYKNENADWITVGWAAGLMNTFPMLVLGDSVHRRKALQTFDFAIPAMQGKSGYYYSLINSKGNVNSREGYDNNPELTLVRRNGNLLFWMMETADAFESTRAW